MAAGLAVGLGTPVQRGAPYDVVRDSSAKQTSPFRKAIAVATLAGLALLLSRFAEHAKSGLVRTSLWVPVVGIVWMPTSNDDGAERDRSLLDRAAGRFALLTAWAREPAPRRP